MPMKERFNKHADGPPVTMWDNVGRGAATPSAQFVNYLHVIGACVKNCFTSADSGVSER